MELLFFRLHLLFSITIILYITDIKIFSEILFKITYEYHQKNQPKVTPFFKAPTTNKNISSENVKSVLGLLTPIASSDSYTNQIHISDLNYSIASKRIYFSTYTVNFFHYTLALLVVIITVSLSIWIRSLYKNLRQLSNIARSFEAGDFHTKVNIPNNSTNAQIFETFSAMADRIKILNTSQKELINAISHELRTPISRLRFGIQLLIENNNSDTILQYIDNLNTDINELDCLISDLLTCAQFECEKPELNFESLNFEAWLKNFANHFYNNVFDVKIHLENNSKLKNRNVTIDSKLIHRAISNLMNNAIRYASSNIRINASCNDKNFTISIEDDGPGIPIKDREKILEPLIRLDYSRNRRTGGCGLGLSIAKKIANWHDGKITITDSSLGGAKFNFECSQNTTKERLVP